MWSWSELQGVFRRPEAGEHRPQGVGFKSVLEITEHPRRTRRPSFSDWDGNKATGHVLAVCGTSSVGAGPGVPAMRFPSPIAEEPRLGTISGPLDSTAPSGSRSTTGDPGAGRHSAPTAHSADDQRAVPQAPRGGRDRGGHRPKAERHWLLERHRVTSAASSDARPRRIGALPGRLGQRRRRRRPVLGRARRGRAIGEHRDGLTGPAWEGVDVSEVSVAVRDADDPQIDADSRRFHVFLPTQEPSGCSVLVNGAFTTDLSRQHVQVSESASDYNAYLVQQAAETFVRPFFRTFSAGGRATSSGSSTGRERRRSGSHAVVGGSAASWRTPRCSRGRATLSLAERPADSSSWCPGRLRRAAEAGLDR